MLEIKKLQTPLRSENSKNRTEYLGVYLFVSNNLDGKARDHHRHRDTNVFEVLLYLLSYSPVHNTGLVRKELI